MATPFNTIESILRKHVVITETCWLWTGSLNKGYGQVGWQGRTRPAHRVIYEGFKKKIPDGLTLDHICRVPRCVNPDHLEPVTQKVNILRGVSPWAERARKVVCLRGHELSGDNLRITASNGTRHCKACEAMRSQQRRA